MKTDRNNLVAAAVYNYDWQAHIAEGILAENGISSIIDNEIMGSTLPLGFNSVGGIRLMVKESDADRAREILRNAPGED